MSQLDEFVIIPHRLTWSLTEDQHENTTMYEIILCCQATKKPGDLNITPEQNNIVFIISSLSPLTATHSSFFLLSHKPQKITSAKKDTRSVLTIFEKIIIDTIRSSRSILSCTSQLSALCEC